MAATVEATRLTEAHRVAQLNLAVETAATMSSLWPLLDPLDLDGTAPRWLRPTLAVVNAQRTKSARIAANYVTGYKALELGVEDTGLPVVIADPLNIEQATTSLIVTGPVSARRALAAGRAVEEAMDLASASSAAAAVRHALNGGRETTTRTVAADRQALGWARVTSGKCCAFCAMLASRGPVYRGANAAFRSHDRCGCSAEPVYRPDAAWPTGSKRWADLWDQAKATAPRRTSQEFRRLIEAA